MYKVLEVSIDNVPHWEIQYPSRKVTIPIDSKDTNMKTLGNLFDEAIEIIVHPSK